MIKATIYIDEPKFDDLKECFIGGFADTIATIENGKIMYELYIDDGRLTCYECEHIEDAGYNGYQTVNETDASYIMDESETLEDFVMHVFRLMLWLKGGYIVNTYNYAEIAKHIFRACRTYAFEYEPIIIFADSLEEAKEKAKKYFNTAVTEPFITVSELIPTEDDTIFEV